jgi:hypothetical protein
VVVTVDCDTRGLAVAQQWLDAANPTHPSLIDTQHRVAQLYNTRNVPAVFWIDETGHIVRANDPIYAQRRNRETGETTIRHDYLDGVRDWVAKGSASIFVQQHVVRDALCVPSAEDALAQAYFRLATFLEQQGHGVAAVPYFREAHALKPENWNYRRQAYSLVDAEAAYGTTMAEVMRDPSSPPFYPPFELPTPP